MIFKKSVLCSPRLHLFKECSKSSNILLQIHTNIITKNLILLQFKELFSIWICFKIEFIHVIKNRIFSVITSVFSVTWSFRNHSNMLIYCSRNISDYYQCWKQFLLFNICVETVIHYNYYTLYFSKLIVLFIDQKWCEKPFLKLQKIFLFQINAALWMFCSLKNHEKNVIFSTQFYKAETVFSIDNDKKKTLLIIKHIIIYNKLLCNNLVY